jgi:hypothetical protein
MFLLFLAGAATLRAQSSPSSPADSSVASTAGAAADSFTSANSDSPQLPTASGFRPSSAAFTGNSPTTSQWNRLIADIFQLGMRSSHLGGGSHGADLDSLFGSAGRLSQDLGKAVNANGDNAAGQALTAVSKLGQAGRGGVSVPVSSPVGRFQFSYKDQLGARGNAMGGDIGRGTAQATYNAAGLKNDLLRFSASAVYGGSAGSGFLGSSAMSTGSFSAGSFGSNSSFGNMYGAGIGSGFSNDSSRSFGDSQFGAAHGGPGSAGGMGKHGEATGPTVSVKLSF